MTPGRLLLQCTCCTGGKENYDHKLPMQSNALLLLPRAQASEKQPTPLTHRSQPTKENAHDAQFRATRAFDPQRAGIMSGHQRHEMTIVRNQFPSLDVLAAE